MKRLENQSVPVDDDRELSIAKLTQITGIAAKTAQAMYEIGIRSYADLVKYLEQHTAQEFSTALKEHGVKRRPGIIDREMWIKQAEMLGQSEKSADTPHNEAVQPEEEAKPPRSGREAKEHDAMFTVSFDTAINDAGERVLSTTVYHEGNGGEELVFQGINASPWVNWIMKRADLPVAMRSSVPEDETSEGSPPIESPARIPPIPGELNDFLLEIYDVQLSVMKPKLAESEKRLGAKINIKLSGSDAERLTMHRIAFRTEMFTINLDDGFPRQVATSEDQLEPHIFEYSYQFEVAIPAVGRYELHSVVHLLPSGELRAYYQGPVLRVTP
jgi:hypothetical protein